ncbi:hypothetical protein ABZT03_02050 [Streptomyces sp. NPDC005574]|uniref:hypothetical protein n=1 Tax=Streptomyces sp. NPDC005574 TaxID=3156891 RepID=UPI0033AFCB10
MIKGAQQPAPVPQVPTAPAVPVSQAPAVEGNVTSLPRWAQQAVTGGQDAARQLATQSAVIAAAPTAGADVSRLLDSRAFMDAMGQVNAADPSAVSAAITAAVQANPHLGLIVGPARGGAAFDANPAGDTKPATLDQAIAARLAANG